jgi:hypothetical protein
MMDSFHVFAGLVPAIHDHLNALVSPAVIMDARNKCGHDGRMEVCGIWYKRCQVA